MTFSLKNYYPHITAIVVFAIVTLIYFKPLLSGKELSQHDITQHKGMSKEILDFRNSENAEPLWTNSMFGGMPAYQISTLYPGNWLGTIDKAFKLFLPHPSGYLFLYFFGFFILLLCLKIEPWLALVGALGYGLSSYYVIIIGAGHNSKANAIGYLAPLLGGIILTLRGRYWFGAALTVLFMALELNANHVQITYYGFMLIGVTLLTYLYFAIKEKQLPSFGKAAVFIAGASIIGVLPNAASLMCTEEYGKYSSRGKTELTIDSKLKSNAGNTTGGLDKDYATQWSYGISETFTFLIPDYKGGASGYIANADPAALKKVNQDYKEQVGGSSSYFGDQLSTGGPSYIGAIIMFLAVLGLFLVKNKIKWALVFATLITVPLSWGHNFMSLTSFFLDHVPGYDKFRAVSMILIVAELTIPLLAILALNELIQAKSLKDKIKISFLKKEIELKKLLIVVFAIVGGFCAIGYVAPDLVNTFHSLNEEGAMMNEAKRQGATDAQASQYATELMPQLEIARKAIFTSDAARSFIFILLAAIFIYLYLNKKIKKELLFGALGIFMLIDNWTVDTRYLNDKSFISKSQNQNALEKSPADEEILKDNSLDYRVLNLTQSPFQDATTSYWHKSIGGYHGAKLKKYQELIDFHIDKDMQKFYEGFNAAKGNDSILNLMYAQLNVLNMLNTKYFIVPLGKEGRTPVPFTNKQANGNVWFVKNIKTAINADSEIVGLYNINTKRQAITQQKFNELVKMEKNYSGEGNIKLVSYKANNLVYESDAAANQFAVFSEIYYPKGWNAYIDGALSAHACVDYVLRGMPIPAGKHKIEFKFEPAVYKTGNTISMAGSVLVLASVALCLYLDRKKKVA